MDSSAGHNPLTPDQQACLGDLLRRFENAWQAQVNPLQTINLQDYLPLSGDPLRPVALQELIRVDLANRWKHGQKVNLDYYLNRHAEVGSATSVPSRLIFEEFRIRKENGDNPILDLYRTRFPGQFPELAKLVQGQSALATLSNPDPSPGGGLPAPAPFPAGPVQFHEGMDVGNGYILIDRLGTGGFGEVWRANSRGGIQVAVKISYQSLDKEESAKELKSMELVKQLRHPYLLQNHAFWTHQGRLHIAMELADGNLRSRLRECRKAGQKGIPAPELLRYFRQVAEALDFLHSRQILHRDIKPDNILLVEGYAKVADFGLARLISAQHSMSVSSSGTPAYMAPEMFASKVTNHTDQYCLAVTYAELRLDRRLFPGQNLVELMMQHVSGTPNLDPLPPAEQEAMLQALAKKPDDRFPNCQTFVSALEQALPREQPPAPPTSVKVPNKPPTRSIAPPMQPVTAPMTDVPYGMTLAGEDRPPRVPSLAPAPAPAYPRTAAVTTAPPPPAKPNWKQAPPPPPAAASPGPGSSRKKVVLIGALAAVVVLAGGGYLLMSLLSKDKLESPKKGPPSKDLVVVKPKDSTREKTGEKTPKDQTSPRDKKPSDKALPPPVDKVREAQKLLDEGFAALEKQELPRAQELFEKVRQTEVAELGPQALLGLAQVHARQGNWPQVRKDFKELGAAPLKSGQNANRQALEALAFEGNPADKLQRLYLVKKGQDPATLSSWERDQVNAQFVRGVETRLPTLEKPADFQTFFPYCQEAQRTAGSSSLIPAGLAECLLSAPGKPSPAALAQAQSALEKLPKDPTGYVSYVQGLLQAATGKTREAGQAVVRAFPEKGAARDWQNPGRKQTAAAILLAAGQKARAANVAEALPLFQKAVQLYPSKDTRYALADAAREKTPTPDWKTVAEQTEALQKDPGLAKLEDKAFAVLRWHAQSLEHLDKKPETLAEYRALFDLYQQGKLLGADRKTIYQDVLGHGLTVGQKWAMAGMNDSFWKNLALLYAARGRFLWDNLKEDLPLKPAERLPQALKDYQQAATNYPTPNRTLAGLLTWNGYLLNRLAPDDVKKLQDLVGQAQKADKDYSGTKYLEGLAAYSRAIQDQVDARKALEEAKQALASFQEAIKRVDKEKPSLAATFKASVALAEAIQQADRDRSSSQRLGLYLAASSRAQRLTAHLLQAQGNAKGKFLPPLNSALKDAQELVGLKLRHPWEALLVRGSAQEDLALLGGKKDLYDAAIKDFSQAITEAPPDDPAGLIARGRVYFRRFKFDKGPPEDLAAAEKDLKAGYQRAQESKDRAGQGEAAIWLARLTLTEGKKNPTAYDKAGPLIEEAIQDAPAAWRSMALDAVYDELNAAALHAYKDNAVALRLYKAARLHGKLFDRKGDWAGLAALPRALSAEYEGELEQFLKNKTEADKAFQIAQKICADALQGKLSDRMRVELLLVRSRMYITSATLREKDLPRDDPHSIKDADEAVKKAEASGLPDRVQAQACFQAGKTRYYKVAVKPGDWDAAQKRKAQEEGVSYLKKAIELDSKNPGVWEWHYYAGGLLAFLSRDETISQAKRTKYYESYRKHFSEVKSHKRAPAWAKKAAEESLKVPEKKKDPDK